MKRVRKKTVVVSQDLEEVKKKIGMKLKKKRKELGYTSYETFSYDISVNRTQYGKYEAGSTDLQLSSLLKVVNAMGLTLEEFFSEDRESSMDTPR